MNRRLSHVASALALLCAASFRRQSFCAGQSELPTAAQTIWCFAIALNGGGTQVMSVLALMDCYVERPPSIRLRQSTAQSVLLASEGCTFAYSTSRALHDEHVCRSLLPVQVVWHDIAITGQTWQVQRAPDAQFLQGVANISGVPTLLCPTCSLQLTLTDTGAAGRRYAFCWAVLVHHSGISYPPVGC